MYIAAAPLSLGILLGVMGFFTFLVTPAIEKHCAAEDAARLMRALRPVYFLFLAVAAAAAGIGLVAKEPWMSKLMLLVAVAAVLCRQVLTPALHKALDKAATGDAKAAGRAGFLARVARGANYAMFGAGLVAMVIHV